MTQNAPIRPASVAGYFYPGDADGLSTTVRGLLEAARTEDVVENPLMIMVPHAGYVYSGRIVAECLIRTQLPKTLFILAPNHTGKGERLAVWPGGSWESPLGPVSVDEDCCRALLESNTGYTADTTAHASDHAIEVLLPFLQTLVPDLRIVPICVAWPDLQGLETAAGALASLMGSLQAQGRNSTIIVSSDMSHFLNQEEANTVDSIALGQILALEPKGLFQTVIGKRISMCGVLPATLGLFAAKQRGASSVLPVAYATSGDVSGNMSRVVGYASLIVA